MSKLNIAICLDEILDLALSHFAFKHFTYSICAVSYDISTIVD